ncbi:MAG: beta-ketoacyl-[acyl-carrier-protein] synthase family protein, partial [Lentisphaeria bacterium]|nr:beta-ketoacyl-[acyl-carrier-protein] synthase family protein [Lentisphaeria bacterium]
DVFGENCPDTYFNNTKSFIGHCMGAAAALELAGNLASFQDHIVHPTINVDELDPLCMLNNLVLNTPTTADRVDHILNNSFGMLGINCVLVLSKLA